LDLLQVLLVLLLVLLNGLQILLVRFLQLVQALALLIDQVFEFTEVVVTDRGAGGLGCCKTEGDSGGEQRR
jgi:hypothetical protein